MKEYKFTCPYCSEELEMRTDYELPFFCHSCDCDFTKEDIICPICGRQKIWIKQLGIYKYCEHCININNFRICPMIRNCDNDIECKGIAVCNSEDIFNFSQMAKCRVPSLNPSVFKFIKDGEEVIGDELLSILKQSIKDGLPDDLKLEPLFQMEIDPKDKQVTIKFLGKYLKSFR